MFRLAVCDNDLEIHQQLRQYFSDLSIHTNFVFDIRYFSSGEDLMAFYEQEGAHVFHVLLLDIEMNGINGIETAQRIRALPDRELQIIFMSSYPEYMIESFDVQTFHYMIKPLAYPQFENILMKVFHYIETSAQSYVVLKIDQEQIVIRTSDVISVVKIKHALSQNRIKVITTKEQYICSGTLADYLNRLGHPFMQIYRSVIINLEHVFRFSADTVIMTNHEQFPIGRTQSKNIKDAYARHVIAQFKERGKSTCTVQHWSE
ncbi:DNA-binding response regulator [Paenibacillus sp. PK3_47]|uniref:LytR/AlgR family response regulator transcription factor n=1 Tax=Paenibacillus sp. PK3_47 TaxID=2072642 RepID=UPI00201E3C5D|nr:LytTR family DNA-binding domain-containing protein [Paenibacillus sp. PK3_47]UQZ35476.1 DNA-binding response regulator [Paenibacillus sp. PK3_47]